MPTRTELWLVRETVGPDPAAIEECVAAGLLTPPPTRSRFATSSPAQAVGSSLSGPRRRELEALVLAALGTREDVDAARLAHHARGARAPEAILRHAGERGACRGRGRRAPRGVEHAEAALAAATELGEDRAELLDLVSTEAYLCGRYDRALVTRRDELALHEAAGRPAETGDSLRSLSRLEWWTGDSAAADGGRPARDRDPRTARPRPPARHGLRLAVGAPHARLAARRGDRDRPPGDRARDRDRR